MQHTFHSQVECLDEGSCWQSRKSFRPNPPQLESQDHPPLLGQGRRQQCRCSLGQEPTPPEKEVKPIYLSKAKQRYGSSSVPTFLGTLLDIDSLETAICRLNGVTKLNEELWSKKFSCTIFDK